MAENVSESERVAANWLGGRDSLKPIRGSKGSVRTYRPTSGGSVDYGFSVLRFRFRSFSEFCWLCQSDVTRNVTRENSISPSHPVEPVRRAIPDARLGVVVLDRALL
jgi:hypothetical protein